jgi:hypothetical protein
MAGNSTKSEIAELRALAAKIGLAGYESDEKSGSEDKAEPADDVAALRALAVRVGLSGYGEA